MVLGHNKDKMLYHRAPNDHASRIANYMPGLLGLPNQKFRHVADVHHKMEIIILESSLSRTRGYNKLHKQVAQTSVLCNILAPEPFLNLHLWIYEGGEKT